MKLESQFVSDEFKPQAEARFPDCFWYKLDSAQYQGIPDLLMLWEDHWAIFETKRGSKSAKQPNQEFYVQKFDAMSASAFVHPQNYIEVLDELERLWK